MVALIGVNAAALEQNHERIPESRVGNYLGRSSAESILELQVCPVYYEDPAALGVA